MDAGGVLHFLRRGGFHRAARAFLDDAQGLPRNGGETDLALPPLRTRPAKAGDDGSSGEDEDEDEDEHFVSISAPSGLIAPRKTRHPAGSRGHSSSDGLSDVRSSEESEFDGCRKDPYLMQADVGRRNGAQIGRLEQPGGSGGTDTGCGDCSKVADHHDCGSEMKEHRNGSSVELVVDSGDSAGWRGSRERVGKLEEEGSGSEYWVGEACPDDISGKLVENLDLRLYDREMLILRNGEGEEEDGRVYTDSNLNIVSAVNGFHDDDIDVHISVQPSLEDSDGASELNDDRNIATGTEDAGLEKELKDKQDVAADLQLLHGQEDEFEIFELRVVHRKNRTGFEESRDMPIILNSLIAGRYYVTEFLGSAAFSKVVQAHDLHTGADVCLKIIKNDKDFFDQSLDEIKLLKFVNKHDPADEHHILRLYDYFYHQEHLFIVCELLKANLYEFQKYNHESDGEMYFTLPRIQAIARQCLEALQYLHGLGIIHCDLKPENILIKSYSRCEVKIIDLGSSCFHSDNLCLYVQSRSYRAPEVILGLPYDQKIDIWSLGCILVELLSGNVLFPNESLEVLLSRIIGLFGPIDKEMLDMGQETHKYFTKEYVIYSRDEETGNVEFIIPEGKLLAQQLGHPDPEFVSFLEYLLETNPQRRPTATEALEHPWLSHSYS